MVHYSISSSFEIPMITLAFMKSKEAYLEEVKHVAQYFSSSFRKYFRRLDELLSKSLILCAKRKVLFVYRQKLILSLYSTISSVSPKVKTNSQKCSTFHLIAQGFGQPMKKKIFLDGPRAPRSTIKKKKKTLGLWGRE